MMFVTPAFAQGAPANGDPNAATGTAPAAEVHTETGVAHEAHGTGVFPPFDHTTYSSQLLWLVITFGFFYWIMQKVVVPRVGGILEHRHDRIAQDLDEASRLKPTPLSRPMKRNWQLPAPRPARLPRPPAKRLVPRL
jgi:F-type H+-transporting ATPase subunit b